MTSITDRPIFVPATLTFFVALTLTACGSSPSGPGTGFGNESDAGTSQDTKTPSTGSSDTGSSTGEKCGGFNSSKALCNTCIQSTCCAQGSACGADASCNSLFACVTACGSDTTCVSSCAKKYPSGVTALQNLFNCVESDCKDACASPKGLGEACTDDSQCLSGDCNGAWCTRGCSQNMDCRSTSTSITNSHGQLVWCLKSSAGTNSCFPGCKTNADCAVYGADLKCLAATAVNGSSTYVCSR
jgi:hypothetical protein